MKVLSLYCGGGGMDQGLKQAGINTTLAIDLDSDSCKTMKLNHDCEVINGNVGDYVDSLDGFDFIIGGPPCPEFSNANTKRTYDSKEVDIFWRIVDKIKPKFHIMENVPNVIKVCKRDNFLINAFNHGVPQTRIRRFFTNLKEPGPGEKKVLNDYFNLEGHTSNSGFSNCNQYEISRPVNQPCKTLQIASTLRLTDKPVYSKKYKHLPQDYKITHIFSNDELKIIQGFPDDYNFYGNKQSVKRQICNAVPPPMIRGLFL